MYKSRRKISRGFTLTELTIVLVILGVIAGLAVPTYNASVEENRRQEAIVNLNAIWMGERIRNMNNPGTGFWDPVEGGANVPVAAVNTNLGIDIAPQFYNITSINANNGANPRTMAVRMTRNGAGGNSTNWVQIDQNGTITTG